MFDVSGERTADDGRRLALELELLDEDLAEEMRPRNWETNANGMIVSGTIEMNRLNAISIALRMPSIWKKRRTTDVGMLMPRIAMQALLALRTAARRSGRPAVPAGRPEGAADEPWQPPRGPAVVARCSRGLSCHLGATDRGADRLLRRGTTQRGRSSGCASTSAIQPIADTTMTERYREGIVDGRVGRSARFRDARALRASRQRRRLPAQPARDGGGRSLRARARFASASPRSSRRCTIRCGSPRTSPSSI